MMSDDQAEQMSTRLDDPNVLRRIVWIWRTSTVLLGPPFVWAVSWATGESFGFGMVMSIALSLIMARQAKRFASGFRDELRRRSWRE